MLSMLEGQFPIISVKIPRNYNGIVKAHTLSGTVHFSNEVAKKLSTIYEKGKESRHFIGDMSSVGRVSEEEEEDLPEVQDEDCDEDKDDELPEQERPKEETTSKGKGKSKEPRYDIMKLKAKTREGETYGEVFIAYLDEPEMPLRALYFA